MSMFDYHITTPTKTQDPLAHGPFRTSQRTAERYLAAQKPLKPSRGVRMLFPIGPPFLFVFRTILDTVGF